MKKVSTLVSGKNVGSRSLNTSDTASATDTSTTKSGGRTVVSSKSARDVHAVYLDILRSDVANIQIVSNDFVITLKSGRKVLVSDGAQKAATDDDFKLVFLDEEVSGHIVFSEVNTGVLENTSWGNAATDLPPQEVVAKSEALALDEESNLVAVNLTGTGAALAWAFSSNIGGGTSIKPQPATSALLLTVTGAAGPMVNEQLINVYGSDGTLISTGIMKKGVSILNLPNGYSGTIMVELVDSNATEVDYMDEHTGALTSLGNSLHAFLVVPNGATHISVSITPATEIAVKLASAKTSASGQATIYPLDSNVVETSNARVSTALGVTDILGSFVTVINTNGTQDASYIEADGISAAEKYGQVLAELSSNNVITGSTEKTTSAYVNALLKIDGTAQSTISQMLEQGAQTFEHGGNATTASYATLDTPAAHSRTLTAPVLMNQLAAEEQTGAVSLSTNATNPKADSLKDLADGAIVLKANTADLVLPVALPAQSITGDTLKLTISGTAQIFTYTLTNTDIARGYADVPLALTTLAQSGVGKKTITAQVQGNVDSADSGIYNAYTVNRGELQVTTNISNYAQANAATSSATLPTIDDYTVLGVTGVTATNLASINDALATSSVTGTSVATSAQVQALVNAYNAILTAADNGDNTHNTANPTQAQYALIGVTGIDTAAKTRLLGDVIDTKPQVDVDATAEVQALADAVCAVMTAAAGAAVPSLEQIQALGITGVTADNLPAILQALAATANDGSAVDTLSELQTVVSTAASAAVAALGVISDYAQTNTQPNPATPSGSAPTVNDYIAAGVTGVTATNLTSINDALATSSVTGTSVATSAQVQALVNAYNAILTAADSGDNSAATLLANQYALVGADIGLAASNSKNLVLLNDIIEGQARVGIDTVAKINTLATIANAIQDTASGTTSNYTLQAVDFAKIGITGVTNNNLPGVLSAMQTANVSGCDSLSKLQALVYGSLGLNLTAITADTGFNNTDFITNDNTLTLSGIASAADGSKIKVVLDENSDNPITLVAIVSGGTWQVSYATVLPDGNHTANTYLVDATTDTILRTVSQQTISIDTSGVNLANGSADVALNGKVIAITAISPDTGANSADFKTSSCNLVFQGTSDASNGTHVALSIDGTVVYTTVNNGLWSYDNTVNTLVAGTHNIQASLVDDAGNIATSTQQTLFINTAPLALTGKTTGDIAATANLDLVFNDEVVAQTGKYIDIVDESTGLVFEHIAVTDTSRVTIFGNTVTINPSANLTLGTTYHALIAPDAFASTSTFYQGLSLSTDWTFRPVDPSTTVIFSGSGITTSNGINTTELAELEISGTISSANLGAITNLAIEKITFTAMDGSGSFDITSDLPSVSGTAWTLTNNIRWTSLLTSGKRYAVSAQLGADINTVHTDSVANSTATLIDTVAPTLTITSSASALHSGETATLTFTFSETPTDFTQNDIAVNNGTLSAFTPTANAQIYTAIFTPSTNLSGNYTSVVVANSSYTDSVGNSGTSASGPDLSIDTTAPTVLNVAIHGLDNDGTTTTNNLVAGDKIQITLTMSEVTTVTGSPIYNIDVGGITKAATYVSGSGTNTLVFSYTIAIGDNDTTGGITAMANALALNGGTLVDSVTNAAITNTMAVTTGANAVGVDTTYTALNTLKDAAQNNTASASTTSETVYTRAGVIGVTSSNLEMINSALNSATIIDNSADTSAKVQAIVDSYNAVLALADNGVSVGTGVTADQYARIGVTGINSATPAANTVPTASKASLLSDAIDLKPRTAIDTVAEVQALADAVTAVMTGAAGGTPPTLAELESLGITGITPDNLATVQAAIAATPDNGSLVNTLAGLQSVVSSGINTATSNALNTISSYASDNSASAPSQTTGTAPTLTDYVNANVNGVTANNLAAINDALATDNVTRIKADTTAEVQDIVNAYNAVFQLADGGTSPGTAATASQFALIGADIGTAANTPIHLALLNNILDKQVSAGVDTVAEINTLAAIANAIQTTAAGGTPTHTLTSNDFSLIGLNGVTNGNLSGILASIATRANDGTETQTLPELQKLINTFVAAPLTIALSHDTGNSSTDNNTRDIAITFGGTLLADGTRYYSVDGGAYTPSYTAPTTQGTHTVATKQVDSAGNSGQVTSLSFTYDNQAPTVTVNGLRLSADTGTSASDFNTQTASQTITGTLSSALLATDLLEGSVDGGITWTDITTKVTGTSISWNGVTLSGSSNIALRITDLAGNIADTTGIQAYVLDTTASFVTVTAIHLSNDTGTSASDFNTKTSSQTITGTLSTTLLPTDILWGSVDDGANWIDITDKISGTAINWSNASLQAGSNNISFKVQDLAGNEGSTFSQNYTLDTTASTTAIDSATLSADTGSSGSDFNTKTAAQTVSGTMSAALTIGETVYVSLDNGSTWTAAATTVGQNTWSLQGQALTASNILQIKVTDLAGNDGTVYSQAYVYDTTAPTTPTVTLASDTGASSSDGITNNNQINVTLSSDTTQWKYSVDSGTTWTTGSGSSFTLTAGAYAANAIQVMAYDLAGNTSTGKISTAVTLDTAAVQTAQINSVDSILANNAGLIYNYNTGSFYKLTTTAATWDNANTAAAGQTLNSIKGHLLQINSASENAYVYANGYSVSSSGGWIGISDKATEGSWTTYYGTNIGEIVWSGAATGSAQNGAYTNWYNNSEPNDGSGLEDFALMYGSTGAGPSYWNDTSSGSTAQYFSEWEGAAVLNRQLYANTGAIKINSTEVGTAYLVKATQTPTTVAQITALADAQWNSVALASSSNVMLSSENFSSTPSGWVSTASYGNVTLATNLGGVMDGFLGRFLDNTGNEVVKKSYNFGATYANQTVTINFDMYAIDSWDGELFKVFVNGSATDVQYYHNTAMTISDGGIYLGNLSASSNGGYANTSTATYGETVHHYTLQGTTDGSGVLTLGFGSKLDGTTLSDESWGIDNVVITTTPTSTMLSLAGLSDGTYKLYTADTAGNLSAAANETIRIGSDTTISSVTLSATGVQNSLLNAGDTITATVNFSEAVSVTGTPELEMWIGSTAVRATYKGGTGTTSLTFSYTIQASENDTNGISINANAITPVSGSTIVGIGSGTATNLQHAAVADNANFKVDNTAPIAQLDLVGTVLANTTGYTYSYDTGSFYKYVNTGASWENANTAAAATTLMSASGHLVHVNTLAETNYVIGTNGLNGNLGWLGGSDKLVEGTWKWYYGATAGESFANGSTSYVGALGGAYNNWYISEPNGNTSENYLETYATGAWNDWLTTNSTIALYYVIEIEGAAILNRQTYANTGSVKITSTEVGATGYTSYLVKDTNTVTSVAQITGLADAQWNSVAITSGGNVQLSSEDFSTTPLGWTSSATYGNVAASANLGAPMDGFLGRFADSTGNQVVSKTYTFAAYANQTVTIDFDMLEIDSWNGNLFKVFVNGTATSAQYYHNATSSIVDGGINLGDLSTGSNGGNSTSSYTEESHHYSLKATLNANGQVTLGFGSVLSGNLTTASWGVDNVQIATASTGSTSLSLAGLADGTYKLYTEDAAGNLSAAANTTITICTATPLVLDLNGDGIHTTSINKGVLFDVNADGQPSISGWTDGKDGLLTLDLNGDGKINDGEELFGNGTNTVNGKASDGYAALSQYDLNTDGVIDTKDAVFSKLQVWVDANVDGVTDAGELHSLTDLSIASLHLQTLASTQTDNGNTLAMTSSWTANDGTLHNMADVWFDANTIEAWIIQAQKVNLADDITANSLDIQLSDVLSTNQKTVVIMTDKNDSVRIAQDGWIDTGTTTVNSHTYDLWSNAGAHLLIEQKATVYQVL